MDDTEAVAQAYLRHQGYEDIAYEPDGNVPPDFLVDSHIAVEVRRLNQHERSMTRVRGLDQVDIPLLGKMRRMLSQIGPPTTGLTWFVIYRFARPVEKWQSLGPKIRSWLESVRDAGEPGRRDHAIGTFSVTVVPAAGAREAAFLIGGTSDEDSGGWLLEEIRRNAAICITDKTAKIARYRDRYSAWWLVLVDHIGYGLSDFDRDLLRCQPPLVHNWQKVVLVNPLDARSNFEL